MWKRLLPGAGSLLRQLRGTEWSQLADYVSPAFFEVLPARALLGQVRELVGSARDRRGFAAAVGEVGAALAARDVPLEVRAEWPAGARALAPDAEPARRALGQRVLEAYFAQLAGADRALLDLRAARFAEPDQGPPRWAPSPFWVAWDPAFLAALRDLYAGYYREDPARFDDALARLALTPARDVFLEHFGPGDQRAVRFEARHFHASFHEAFVRCRDAGTSLHPNFLPLGVMLASVCDHLETLGLAFDVRGAWEQVAGS
ncbi:MAG: hypothetical protein R3263_00575 [Myxococcota bacterium]|nr:hypothetical protein [Myxococcota bacterium]